MGEVLRLQSEAQKGGVMPRKYGGRREVFHGNPSPVGTGCVRQVARSSEWPSAIPSDGNGRIEWPDNFGSGRKADVRASQGIPTASPRDPHGAEGREAYTMRIELGERAKDLLFGNVGKARLQLSLKDAGVMATRQTLSRHVTKAKAKAVALETLKVRAATESHPVVLGSELARHLGIKAIGNVE